MIKIGDNNFITFSAVIMIIIFFVLSFSGIFSEIKSLTIIGNIGILLFSITGIYFVNKSVGTKLKALALKSDDRRHVIEEEIKFLDRIMERVGSGDLTTKVNPKEFVVLKEVAKNLNNVLQYMKNAIQEIQQFSFDISSSSNQILSITGQQASGSAEQAASVTEITSTMEELARTAAQIANNTNSVSSISENTLKVTNEGGNFVSESLDGIELMSHRMEEISKKSMILGDKSQQMSKILDIITDIASETHLLALNAAIEAASAGEYGKRFAVIANEVRRLAQKSQESVDNIKNISEEFRHAINSNILATEEGNKVVKKVKEYSNQVGISFENIKNIVQESTQLTKEISMATQQQRTASDQIVLTLKDISEVSKQSADGLKESTGAAKNLAELAMRLQLIAQSFTLDNRKSLKNIMRKFADKEDIKNMGSLEQKNYVRSIADENPFIELIFVTDEQGVMKNFSLNKELRDTNFDVLQVGKDFSSRPWFIEAIRQKEAYITDPYNSMLTNEDCFTVSLPVYNDENDVIGVLGADINLKNWTKI